MPSSNGASGGKDPGSQKSPASPASYDERHDEKHGEKRGDGRAAISLRVDYKRLNTFFADYTKNISKGGTFIRTTKPLDVGTEFVFVLSVPSHNKQLELKGEVVWVVTDDKATADSPAGMGIKFRYTDDAERLAVD